MAVIGFSGASITQIPINNDVVIASYIYNDADIVNVSIEAGASVPSTAVISFPAFVYGRQPVFLDNVIDIYLDTWRNGYFRQPVFQGFIQSENQEYSTQMATAYNAVDVRQRMNEVSVRRDFNMPDRTSGLPRERLSYAQIARQIVRDFNADSGVAIDVEIDTSGLSNAEAPAIAATGMRVSGLLDNLLLMSPDAQGAKWRVDYRRGGTAILSIYFTGSGQSRWIGYGADATIGYTTQGVNCDEISTVNSIDGLVNRVIAIGGNDIVQNSWTLSPAWPSTLDGVSESIIISNRAKYASKIDLELKTPLGGDLVNPSYIPGAEFVGTLYEIPALTLFDETTNLEQGTADSTSAQYPEIINRLVGSGDRAFLVYRSNQFTAGQYLIKDSGFSIVNNRYVQLSEPLVFDLDLSGIVTATNLTVTAGTDPDGGDDDYVNITLAGTTENQLADDQIKVERNQEQILEARTWPVFSVADGYLTSYSFEDSSNLDVTCPITGDATSVIGWRVSFAGYDIGDDVTVTSVSTFGDYVVFSITKSTGNFTGADVSQWNENIRTGVPFRIILQNVAEDWRDFATMSIISNGAADASDIVLCEVASIPDDDAGDPIDLSSAIYRYSLIETADPDPVSYTADELYLVACYRDTTRLKVDTGKIGDAVIETIERYREEKLHREYVAAGTWTRSGETLSGRVTSKTLMRDDTAALTQLANDRVKATYQADVRHQCNMPAFPTYFKVGDAVASLDNRINGKSINGVMYDCQTMDTRIMVGV